jgi:hypothetical protein
MVVDERHSPEVFDHDERRHGLEHRDLDVLTLTGSLPVKEGGEERVDHREPGRLVGDERRNELGARRPRLSRAASPVAA